GRQPERACWFVAGCGRAGAGRAVPRAPLGRVYHSGMNRHSAQARWERRTQRPLLALAVAFAIAYAVPIVDSPARRSVTVVCTATEWVVWAAFAVDYLMRLALTPRRREFVRTHWMDLCAVVLPLLQPLRLLRM